MKALVLALSITACGVAGLLAPGWPDIALPAWLSPEAGQTRVQALQDELVTLRSELGAVRDAMQTESLHTLEQEMVQATGWRELASALARAEAERGEIALAIEHNREDISALTSSGPEAQAIEARFTDLDSRLQEHWKGLSGLVGDARELAGENRMDLEALSAEGKRDRVAMWRSLVGPVVQLAGDTSVGSGILLESRQRAPGKGWSTPLLTAWHVVRDIQKGPGDPLPVTIYLEEGSTRFESARLLDFDVGQDIALLELESNEFVPNGARLAPRERIDRVGTFLQIYAVGCPLGNDPIPTHGEISDAAHLIDGQRYWMINAPTFIGNSGGGIFDATTHELLGVFSKIYNYGSLRPTIVPHMGLATPLDRVYDWLEETGHGELEPRPGKPATEDSTLTASLDRS